MKTNNTEGKLATIKQSKIPAKKLTAMAMLTALSIVLVSLIHFSIFPAAPFLEYDPADIPIVIGTLIFGPLSGLVLTLIVSIIQGVTVSSSGGIYGIIMHFVATGAFVIIAGNVYKINKSIKMAVFALILGIIAMVSVMIIANLLITPHFTGLKIEAVKAMLIPIIIPFNLIKAGVNAFVTLLLYTPIFMYIKREV